jgi:hypothetical protein
MSRHHRVADGDRVGEHREVRRDAEAGKRLIEIGRIVLLQTHGRNRRHLCGPLTSPELQT